MLKSTKSEARNPKQLLNSKELNSKQIQDWSHEYFSTEKSLDPASRRRAPSLKLGPIPISTRSWE